MDYLLFAKALMIGFAIAAPVGPIGMICIQRTLMYGSKSGLASGLGAASADAIYGAIGALGLTALTHALTSASTPLSIFGVIVMSWLGIKFLLPGKGKHNPSGKHSGDTLKAYLSTFLLTLANPMTILAFIGVFAALGSNMQLDSTSVGIMISGVFLGSVGWWLSLVFAVSIIKHKIDTGTMLWISRIAGITLLGFAGWQLKNLLG